MFRETGSPTVFYLLQIYEHLAKNCFYNGAYDNSDVNLKFCKTNR